MQEGQAFSLGLDLARKLCFLFVSLKLNLLNSALKRNYYWVFILNAMNPSTSFVLREKMRMRVEDFAEEVSNQVGFPVIRGSNPTIPRLGLMMMAPPTHLPYLLFRTGMKTGWSVRSNPFGYFASSVELNSTESVYLATTSESKPPLSITETSVPRSCSRLRPGGLNIRAEPEAT